MRLVAFRKRLIINKEKRNVKWYVNVWFVQAQAHDLTRNLPNMGKGRKKT